jgi:hypothetical protein
MYEPTHACAPSFLPMQLARRAPPHASRQASCITRSPHQVATCCAQTEGVGSAAAAVISSRQGCNYGACAAASSLIRNFRRDALSSPGGATHSGSRSLSASLSVPPLMCRHNLPSPGPTVTMRSSQTPGRSLTRGLYHGTPPSLPARLGSVSRGEPDPGSRGPPGGAGHVSAQPAPGEMLEAQPRDACPCLAPPVATSGRGSARQGCPVLVYENACIRSLLCCSLCEGPERATSRLDIMVQDRRVAGGGRRRGGGVARLVDGRGRQLPSEPHSGRQGGGCQRRVGCP